MSSSVRRRFPLPFAFVLSQPLFSLAGSCSAVHLTRIFFFSQAKDKNGENRVKPANAKMTGDGVQFR
ncbi:unnamed protein product [Victoria cruziana]